MKTLPETHRELAERLAAAKKARDDAEAAYRAALDAFTLAEPEGAEGFGVRVTQLVRKGAVAYAKALADLVPGLEPEDLDEWRGSESLYYRVEVRK